LKQKINGQINELITQILDFSRHIAGQSKIVAITTVNNYVTKLSNEKAIYEVMLVIEDFSPRLMSYIKTFNGKAIFVFAIDRWIFERDIERGILGEAIASKLILPNQPLFGGSYLKEHEIMLKKRLSLEILENLVLDFPELVTHMQILPQYFLYEILSNRLRVFPLMAYNWDGLTDCLLENEESALTGYNEALNQLEKEGKIVHVNGSIKITGDFIKRCQNSRIRITNLAKNAPRTLFSSLFGVFPQLMNTISQNTEEFIRTQRINWLRQLEPSCKLVDPQKYVLFPTGDTLVSLADKTNIKGFVEKMIPKEQSGSIEVERVGGMLNDVFRIKAMGNDIEIKVLAKRFKDWSGFKWFPLTLWSFGARSFSVSGQARLAKECATSELLRSKHFNVPKILHVSAPERLVFMEYIDGENLSQTIKKIASARNEDPTESEFHLISKVGELLARVHSHNVTLGDTKPDNILIDNKGKMFLIDFEQATQGGDIAWDIAVFLYYCGHYLQPFYSNAKAETIAKAFIRGYLKEGGNIDSIHKAGSQKYRRVFSIFTMPSTMLAISNECKNAKLFLEK
jgi:Kae1-associated kinase Bud32